MKSDAIKLDSGISAVFGVMHTNLKTGERQLCDFDGRNLYESHRTMRGAWRVASRLNRSAARFDWPSRYEPVRVAEPVRPWFAGEPWPGE